MNQKFGFYFPDEYSVSCSQRGKKRVKTFMYIYLYICMHIYKYMLAKYAK